MSELTLVIADKIVKIVAAFVLGEERLITANDIATLCGTFFKGKDDVSELQMKTSLHLAQLELHKGIQTLLSRGNFTEQQITMLEQCVIDSLEHTDLSSEHLAQMRNDSNKLYRELIGNCKDMKMLSQLEEDYVKKCLLFTASEIISITSNYSSDFSAMNYKQILEEIEDLKNYLSLNIPQIIEALCPKENQISDFYAEYMQALKQHHSYVELFTSRIDSGFAKSYSLDLAYIELFLKMHESHNGPALSIQKLLEQGSRWLIIGEAGCGKTTLLKWIILTIATNSIKDRKMNLLNGYFPIIISLRSVKSWERLSLKQAIEEVFGDFRVNVPAKIIKELQSTGKKTLLLIDGLDEIDEENRAQLYKWLFELNAERENWVKCENERKLVEHRKKMNDENAQLPDKEKAKNEIIIIITSRPIIESNAVSNLQKDIGFKTADVQPMTYMDVQRFVDYWHKAICYGRNFDKDKLLEKARLLKTRIGAQESLSRLAQNPLLCAMICALHYKKDGILPTNKLDLYDSCSRMLLEERDALRKISTGKYCQIMELEFEDKQRILADLALWMLENSGALMIDFYEAASRLKSKISFIQSLNKNNVVDAEMQSKLILSYFIERGSILNWIGNGKICFIHKTFQEYFAAYQIYLGEEWNKIVSPRRATDVLWREIIILAVSFSNRKSAEKVINTFLCRSGDRKNNNIPKAETKGQQIVYRLLAINCAASARELLPDTKSEIDNCTKSLIPPQTTDIERSLSQCGNLVVPLLAFNPTMHEAYQERCARILLEVRTRQSLAQLIAYLESRSLKVFTAIRNYWPYLSKDILVESGIVPAYIEATFVHSIRNHHGTVELHKTAIIQLSRIANCCSYKFEKYPDTYVLSELMDSRLKRRMSRIDILNIQNHMINTPQRNEAILKILDLFSISQSITTIFVSYEYGANELSKFYYLISQYKNLKKITIYDVPSDIKTSLNDKLKTLALDEIYIKEKHKT